MSHPALRLVLATRRKTRQLGAALASRARPGDLIWLEGELGAGKTFLTRGLLRALGVAASIPVTSPTFTLMREYLARIPVYHLDLYRLTDPSEIPELGIDEALSTGLVVIEWGARFREAIATRGLEVTLSTPIEGPGRVADLRALDARSEELLRGVADTASLR